MEYEKNYYQITKLLALYKEKNMEKLEEFTGVYNIEDHIATENLNTGKKVYGERLIEVDDKEYQNMGASAI